MKVSESFYAALHYAHQHGVVVRLDPKRRYDSSSRFHGEYSSIEKPDLIVWTSRVTDGLAASALVHEVNHCRVWGRTGVDPDGQDEHASLLALDHLAIRACGAAWHAWMRDYGIGPVGGDWAEDAAWHDWYDDEVPARHRRRMLDLAYAVARQEGFIP